MSPRVVVVCLGNRYRGDDAAGPAIADLLRERLPAGVELAAVEDEPTRLLDAWQGADAAVVVDAITSGAPAGTLHRFDASAEPVPARAFRSSTHAYGLAETVELGRALGRLPRRLVILGVEGASAAAGTRLTPAVEAALEPAADAVLGELAALSGEA